MGTRIYLPQIPIEGPCFACSQTGHFARNRPRARLEQRGQSVTSVVRSDISNESVQTLEKRTSEVIRRIDRSLMTAEQ